jgi:hypothetical protein
MHNLHIHSHLSRFEHLFLGTFQIGHFKLGIFLGLGTMGHGRMAKDNGKTLSDIQGKGKIKFSELWSDIEMMSRDIKLGIG